MKRQVTQALILDRHKVNNDIIIHALAPGQGRFSAVARHARRSRKRFGGHLESLSLVELTYRMRPDWELARLDEAKLVGAFSVLKADLLRVALASVMAEVVLGFTRLGATDDELYGLTLRAFQTLDDPQRDMDESLLALFELRVLQFSGFLPPLAELFGAENAALEHCERWLEGLWRPMDWELAEATSRRFEAIIEEHLGRPLRARALLDEALAWAR